MRLSAITTNGRRLIDFGGACATATLLWVATTAAASPPDEQHFIETNYCAVYERLRLIRRSGNPDTSHDRFLAVTRADDAGAYVQCIFFENSTKLYCEANSGLYSGATPATATYVLPPERIAALGKLGFDIEVKDGNYKQEIAASDDKALGAVAKMLLKALVVGYGGRADTKLKYVAPFAPESKGPYRCLATS